MTEDSPFAFVQSVHATIWTELIEQAACEAAPARARLAQPAVPEPGPEPARPVRPPERFPSAPFPVAAPIDLGQFRLGGAVVLDPPLPLGKRSINQLLYLEPPAVRTAHLDYEARLAAWRTQRDAWALDELARGTATATLAKWTRRITLLREGKAALLAAGEHALYYDILAREATARTQARQAQGPVQLRTRYCKCCGVVPLVPQAAWSTYDDDPNLFCGKRCQDHYPTWRYRGDWPATQCVCGLYFLAPAEPQFADLPAGSPECAAMIDDSSIDLDALTLTQADWARIIHDETVPRPPHNPADRERKFERQFEQLKRQLADATNRALPASAATALPAAAKALPPALSEEEQADDAAVLAALRAAGRPLEFDELRAAVHRHHTRVRASLARLEQPPAEVHRLGSGSRAQPGRPADPFRWELAPGS